jgi:hypothetical protein
MRTAKKLSPIFLAIALTHLFRAPIANAQKLTPPITAAFDQYISAAESRNSQSHHGKNNFLLIDTQPAQQRAKSYSDLNAGKVLIERTHSAQIAAAPGSLIHDWTATIFIPNITLAQTLHALQDYDRDSDYYAPAVIQSKLLHHAGNNFKVALRLKQEHALTVILDTEYDILYTPIDATHAASQSRSTKIAEVENAGTAREKILTPSNDHGFLWRLNTYWRFVEADHGVYIQCNAISLTRDIPTGLNWLIAPFLENIPRDSLQFTLTATRTALLKKFPAAMNTPNSKTQEK